MNERTAALNYLRIIACIMVIGIHLLGWLSGMNSNGTSILYTVIEHII